MRYSQRDALKSRKQTEYYRRNVSFEQTEIRRHDVQALSLHHKEISRKFLGQIQERQ